MQLLIKVKEVGECLQMKSARAADLHELQKAVALSSGRGCEYVTM
jgi:hypothetical protein